MSMEIRLSQFVIHSDDATISCPGLELRPGETLLASWYVPVDNVGSQLTGYATIQPFLSPKGDQVQLSIKPVPPPPAPGSNPMGVMVFAITER
jgi:hypothetical protein